MTSSSADVAGKIDTADQEGDAVGVQRVRLPGGMDGEAHLVGRAAVADLKARGGVHVLFVPARNSAVGVLLLVREPLKRIEAVPQGELERLQRVGAGDGRLVADTDSLDHD